MKDWLSQIKQCTDLKQLEEIRIAVLGKKGELTAQFANLRNLSGEEKQRSAKELNEFKESFSNHLEAKKLELQKIAIEERLKEEKIDVSLFDFKNPTGAYHPVMMTMDKMIDYFVSMNFSIETGPLIEDDFHNFEALNLPSYHPARDMQDTFYFEDSMLLRTHTSPVQIRTMKEQKPPIRIISPGAVFRRDYDLTHTPMFHQVEGLVVDDAGKISYANLKYILEDFLQHMFGDIDVRFRTSFFPFTEPSAEVDISCIFCGGKGCRVCSHTGWIEVLGCGLVDPNVFKFVGYENVSGYAFGLGVERFAMFLHGVNDLRSLFEGDLRLLEQFQ